MRDPRCGSVTGGAARLWFPASLGLGADRFLEDAEGLDLQFDLVSGESLQSCSMVEPPLTVPEPRSQPGRRISPWEAHATTSSRPKIVSPELPSRRVSSLSRACMPEVATPGELIDGGDEGPEEQAKCLPLHGSSLPSISRN